MSNLKDEYAEIFEEGDRIKITFGSNTVIGEILSWGQNILKYKKTNGKKGAITIDQITSIDFDDGTEEEPSNESAVQVIHTLEKTEEPGLPQPVPFHLSISQTAARMIQSLPSQTGNIYSQLVRILRSIEKSGSNTSQYTDRKAALFQLLEEAQEQEEVLSIFKTLGLAGLQAQQYASSIEPLALAGEFQLASFAASRLGFHRYQEALSLCALLAKEQGAQIDQSVLTSVNHSKDLDYLARLAETFKEDETQLKRIELIARELYKTVFGFSFSPSSFDTPFLSVSKMIKQCKEKTGNSSGSGANILYGKVKEYPFPTLNIEEDQCGTINYIKSDSGFGYLKNGTFFHLSQIRDDSLRGRLLRYLFQTGQAVGLEINYYDGQGPNGPAATDIELSLEGYQDALSSLEKPRYAQGTIFSYHSEISFGRIESAGSTYNFLLSSVRDPYLAAFLEDGFNHADQPVLFVAGSLKGKKTAAEILWDDPEAELKEIYGKSLPLKVKQEFENWKERTSRRPVDFTDEGLEAFLASASLGPAFYDLPSLQEQQSVLSPFTWNVEVDLFEDPEPKPNPSPVKKEKTEGKTFFNPSPIPRSQPISESIIYTGNHYQSDSSLRNAEKGRKAVIRGDLDAGEKYLLKAIEEPEDAASIMGDLVSLYIRKGDSDSLLKAENMMDKYNGFLNSSKALNLRISLYNKTKEYDKLVPLLWKAVEGEWDVSKKCHNLVGLMIAYNKLGDFENIIKSFSMFEKQASSELYSKSNEINRNRRPSAIKIAAPAYYRLGTEKDDQTLIKKARELAKELIKGNPADEVGNAILNDDLILSAESPEAISEESVFSEAVTTSNLPKLVQDLIKNAELVGSVKSNFFINGNYLGDNKQALKDVERMIKKAHYNSKSRADKLFTSCRILQLADLNSGKTQENLTFEYALAGRGMTSWADSNVVTAAGNLDSARTGYLFAVSVLGPREQDLTNAFNRYLRSYFQGKELLGNYIQDQFKNGARDTLTHEYLDKTFSLLIVPELTVGLFELKEAIKKNADCDGQIFEAFLESLFNRHPELIEEMIQHFGGLLQMDLPEENSFEDFVEYFDEAGSLREEYVETIRNEVKNALKQIGKQSMNQAVIENLISDDKGFYLYKTDVECLRKIAAVCRKSIDYSSSTDFDTRADSLRSMISRLSELYASIEKDPTNFTYGELLSLIDEKTAELTKEQEALYNDYSPALTIKQSLNPYKTNSEFVQVQLILENRLNHQTADNIQIEIITSPEVINYKQNQNKYSLRGGENKEIVQLIGITREAEKAGSFTLELVCSYRSTDPKENPHHHQIRQSFNMVLTNADFKPYINPYAGYEGNPVTENSMFYGRDSFIDQIMQTITIDGIHGNYGHGLAMYGQTRTGKTSILYHLKERIMKEMKGKALICDMKNIGEIPVTGNVNFFALFLKTMLTSINDGLKENGWIKQEDEIKKIYNPYREVNGDLSEALDLFRDYMTEISYILRKNGITIVLMIDEFSYLHSYVKDGRIPREFMRFWKALLQNYPIFAIISAQDDMPDFIRENQNEFACMELIKLSYLNETSSLQLIREPLERCNGNKPLFNNDGCVHKIYELTAGNPFLTVVLCSRLVSYLNERGIPMITNGIIDDFLASYVMGEKSFLSDAYFEGPMLERGRPDLNEINALILHGIAQATRKNGSANPATLSVGNLSKDELFEYVKRLTDRDVLSVENGKYRIRVKLLEDWLLHTRGEE